jgi:hypothetical protein
MPPTPVGNEVLWTSIFTPVVFNSGFYAGTRDFIAPGPTVADNQMNLTNGVLHISDSTGDWMDGTFYTGTTVGSLIRLYTFVNDADHRAEFLVTKVERDPADRSWKFTVNQMSQGALFPDLATETPGGVTIEVDSAPSSVFTGFKPGEILTVVDPVSHIPASTPGITGRPPAATGDLIRVVDTNADGTADSFEFLPAGSGEQGLSVRGIIDGVGTEPHTYVWGNLAITTDITGVRTDRVCIWNASAGTGDPGATEIIHTAVAQGGETTVKVNWGMADTSTLDSTWVDKEFLPGRTVLLEEQNNPTTKFLYGVLTARPVPKQGFFEFILADVTLGSGGAPGAFTHVYVYKVANNPVKDFKPGEYLLVDDVPANGKVPALVLGAGGKPVAIGDWLVAIDSNQDQEADTWHLLPMKTQAKSSIFYFTSDANADHATRWSLADLIDDTKVPVRSWVVVADDVNQQAPAGLSWVDVDGTDYVAGTVNPPRGSLAQKIASKQFVEHWRPEQQWVLHVTAPPGRPFHTSYAWFNSRQWDWFKVGQQYVVGEVSNGMLPAMAKFPSLTSEQPAKPGDVLVPVDLNNDGTADDVLLIRQDVGLITHHDTPAEGPSPIYFDRGIPKHNVANVANNVNTGSDAKLRGRWEITIFCQPRAACDLSLIFHTGHMNSAGSSLPTDAPAHTADGKEAFGPWNVKAGAPTSIRIIGDLWSYSLWRVEFSSQDASGNRIFDVQTRVEENSGSVLPAIGLHTSTGNIYARAFFTTHKEAK